MVSSMKLHAQRWLNSRQTVCCLAHCSGSAMEPFINCAHIAACYGYPLLSMLVLLRAQELNLFCTLCTSLFALGCLVLSIINGAFKMPPNLHYYHMRDQL